MKQKCQCDLKTKNEIKKWVKEIDNILNTPGAGDYELTTLVNKMEIYIGERDCD